MNLNYFIQQTVMSNLVSVAYEEIYFRGGLASAQF
jgi:hypothetical protein